VNKIFSRRDSLNVVLSAILDAIAWIHLFRREITKEMKPKYLQIHMDRALAFVFF